MKKFAIALGAIALAAGFVPATSMAQDGAAVVEVKRGSMIYSGDGKRIGNVYRVSSEGDAQIIYRGKLITISASTLTEASGKLSTSLTLAEVRALV